MSTKKAHSAVVQALDEVLVALDGLEQSDQLWVLQTVWSRLGIASAPAPAAGSMARGLPAPTPISAMPASTDPKTFIRQKAPINDVQRVACLAYFLTHVRGTPHFKSRDIAALNTDAAGPRINMSRAVNNAANQNHYLAPAGGGKKQITSRGEDVVNALPDQEAVRAADVDSRPVKRKRTGVKKASRKD